MERLPRWALLLGVGVGLMLAVVVVAGLFINGYSTEGAIAAAAATAVAEGARRTRAARLGNLEQIGDQAEEGIVKAESLRVGLHTELAGIRSEADGAPLEDLVREEQERGRS